MRGASASTHLRAAARLLLTAAAAPAARLASIRAGRAKAAQAAEHEGMLALAGEIGNIGHWRLGLPDQTVSWCPRVYAMHGRDVALGPPSFADALRFYVPEDRDRVVRLVEAAIEKQDGFEFSARLVQSGGATIDVLSRGIVSRSASGAATAVFGILMDMTAVRKAERAMEESEHFLHGVLDGSPDAVMVFGTDGAFSFLSNKAVAMVGAYLRGGDAGSGDTGAMLTFDELWPHACRAEIACAVAVARSGAPAAFEARLRGDGGDARTFAVALSPVKGAGQDGRLIAIARDVTEFNAVRDRKERAERQFRLLADHAQDVIFLRNATPGAPHKYASPACREVLGFTPSDFCALPYEATIHPEDREALDALYRGLGPNHPSAQSTHRVRHAMREWLWVEVTLKFAAAFDDGNEVGPVVVGSMRDISHRKQVEASLAHSEELYRLVARNVTDVILKVDDAGRILFASPSSERLLGRNPEEMVGSPAMALLHPDDAAPIRAALRQRRREDGEAKWRFEYRLLHRDGTWIWIESDAFRFADAGGSSGFIAILRDFRDRKVVQDRLTAALQSAETARSQAEAANRAKSDFLAAMSHEIRTPLNSIIGFTEITLDDPALVGEPRRHAEMVQASGAALLTVINDILDFSKIEAGAIEVDAAPFATAAPVSAALSIVRGIADAKGLILNATVDEALPPTLLGDQARIRQVLLNLLNNAIKFTPSGSVTLDVRVERGADGDRIRFTVADTGIGIDLVDQPRLFKRFSQADASINRQFGGTGLGLAISKSLVEAMGGTIGVTSAAGEGATFWFALPLRPAPSATDAVAAPARPERRTGHILLAEDIEVNQLLARALIEAEGYTLDVVGSGEAAVAALTAGPYDLVLMDIQMPGMGGIAAARAIRAASGPESGVPIVAMTANVLSDQIEAFRLAGMDDHIGKPIDRAILRAVLDRWLPGGAAGFDRAAFAAFAQLCGPVATAGTLGQFRDELQGRFRRGDAALPADARAVRDGAAMLGFTALAARCADLEPASGGPAIPPAAGAAARRESDRALVVVARLLAEVETAAGLRAA